MELSDKLIDVNTMSLAQLTAELEERMEALRYVPANEKVGECWPMVYRHAGGVIVKFNDAEPGSNLGRESMARYVAWLRKGNKGTYRMMAREKTGRLGVDDAALWAGG